MRQIEPTQDKEIRSPDSLPAEAALVDRGAEEAVVAAVADNSFSGRQVAALAISTFLINA